MIPPTFFVSPEKEVSALKAFVGWYWKLLGAVILHNHSPQKLSVLAHRMFACWQEALGQGNRTASKCPIGLQTFCGLKLEASGGLWSCMTSGTYPLLESMGAWSRTRSSWPPEAFGAQNVWMPTGGFGAVKSYCLKASHSHQLANTLWVKTGSFWKPWSCMAERLDRIQLARSLQGKRSDMAGWGDGGSNCGENEVSQWVRWSLG